MREQFRETLLRLASSASEQEAYLRKLGTAPSADELALEFSDALGVVQEQLDEDARTVSSRLDRHLEEGLSRIAVQDAIRKHLPSVVDKIPSGKPLNQVIEVGGKRIQYSAFRLPDGSINVGRIHGVP